MLLSILHRVTGVFLSLSLVVFALWLIRVAAGPEQYQYFREAMSSPVGLVLMIGGTFAFLLHTANGVRHLVSDTGRGLEIRAANTSAWLALLFSALSTALLWGLRL
jgi:succinate dehydrogenase / fumarate reductase, cytochrome b subunit